MKIVCNVCPREDPFESIYDQNIIPSHCSHMNNTEQETYFRVPFKVLFQGSSTSSGVQSGFFYQQTREGRDIRRSGLLRAEAIKGDHVSNPGLWPRPNCELSSRGIIGSYPGICTCRHCTTHVLLLLNCLFAQSDLRENACGHFFSRLLPGLGCCSPRPRT